MPALCQWDRLNTAAFHKGLERGRSLLGIGQFRQMQSPVPRPHRCSWSGYDHRWCFRYTRRPDIRRTRWSSRVDTVFLLESWGLLIDLPRSKPHTAPGYRTVDYRRCCLRRIGYCEQYQSWTVHIQLQKFRKYIPDDQRYNFSTVEWPVDKGSWCRSLRGCDAGLLHALLQPIRIQS